VLARNLHQVLYQKTQASEKSNVHCFYPKYLNHEFIPKLDFEGYRNDVKPDFEGYRNDVKKAYENDQYPLGVDEHQVPDHPSSFANIIIGRSQAI
jgi:hypothetical protein